MKNELLRILDDLDTAEQGKKRDEEEGGRRRKEERGIGRKEGREGRRDKESETRPIRPTMRPHDDEMIV